MSEKKNLQSSLEAKGQTIQTEEANLNQMRTFYAEAQEHLTTIVNMNTKLQAALDNQSEATKAFATREDEITKARDAWVKAHKKASEFLAKPNDPITIIPQKKKGTKNTKAQNTLEKVQADLAKSLASTPKSASEKAGENKEDLNDSVHSDANYNDSDSDAGGGDSMIVDPKEFDASIPAASAVEVKKEDAAEEARLAAEADAAASAVVEEDGPPTEENSQVDSVQTPRKKNQP